jgi:hypothetical protein
MNVFTQVPVVLLLIVSMAGVLAAEQKPAPTKPARAASTVTLTGCISANPNQPGGFTLSDTDNLSSYRLTGTNVRDFSGQRVQVSGVTPKRWQIAGGLYPSPNIAAQGGSDPVKAAMAAAGDSNAAGGKPLSEFRVRSIRAIPGTCPEQ